jgi:hypothetical protein
MFSIPFWSTSYGFKHANTYFFHHYFSELALNGTYSMLSPFSIWALADGSPHETSPGPPQLCSSDAGSIM